MPATAPYGSWDSPVTAELAAGHDGRPDWVGAVGDELWWTEPRPAEGGRAALVRRRPGGGPEVVLPAPWNVRSRVMEYGGRPWAGAAAGAAAQGVADGWAGAGPVVVFVHFADQRMYRYAPDAPGAVPVPLTPEPAIRAGLRFVDLTLDPERGEVRCVLEEFTGERPHELRRAIVAVPLDGSAAGDRAAIRELAGGHRFLTGPRISPDGRRAAWIAWDHPAMPWDGTELRVADIAEDGTYQAARTVAGGPEESVAQAEWAADGTLIAATDRTGWWNLHRIGLTPGEAVGDGAAGNLCPRDEEFAGPLWRPGSQWFAPLPDGRIAVAHGCGAQRLGLLDPRTGGLTDVAGPYTEWGATLAVTPDGVAGVAASAQRSFEVVEVRGASGTGDGGAGGRGGGSRGVSGARPVSTSPDGSDGGVDPAYLSEPRERTFTGPDGREVHAQIHPPRNPARTAPDGELPPYAVWAHGGPTGRVPLVRDLEIAYFTSRGIGVAVVNYGGSAGYGREYRNRLRESWGVVDVEDCAVVARALAAEGSADPDRLAIRGGSAGGWTTGASLTSTDVYRCGVIFFPVLDLTSFGPEGTHDFEAYYMHSLVGPLPESADRYRERSPVNRADRLTVPFLLLQGLEDVICPPAQSETFLARATASAKARGRAIPHAYLTFEGEGHGFRRLETMVTCLEAELSLYGQVLGFDPPGVPVLALVT